MAKYKIVTPWGGRKKGEIVDDSTREIRRKLQEGGCLEKVAPPAKNKMQPDAAKNKGDK